MSWQATAWAIKQVTGSPSCKLTLLTLANYADDTGCCWPSQETLAADTEQSIDTVQRKLKDLSARGLIRKIIRPQGRGRWSGRTYFLNMTVAEMTMPQIAAWSSDGPSSAAGSQGDRHHAAPDTPPSRTTPADHAAPLRHEPSIEPSLEPSLEASAPKKQKLNPAERQKAFKEGRKGLEVLQNQIARRLGRDGWAILQSLSAADLDHVTKLEERRRLDDTGLELMRSHYLANIRGVA